MIILHLHFAINKKKKNIASSKLRTIQSINQLIQSELKW